MMEFFKNEKSVDGTPSINLQDIVLTGNCDFKDVRKFEDLYKNHCKELLELVIGLKLSSIEELYKKFWRCDNVDCSEYESILTKDKFIALCTVPEVIEFVKLCDYQVYQSCLNLLIPDVLKETPINLLNEIRNFAKSLENSLKNALINIPEGMQQMKMKNINALVMILRRYTKLNCFSKAAREVFKNPQYLSQLLVDLNKVDFSSIQQQASFIFKCNDKFGNNFEKELKKNVESEISIEEWAKWLESFLTAHDSFDSFFKWSFYCSTIFRDLTVRNAQSFGVFNAIRLFSDDYMFYLAENKKAKSLNETLIAVIADQSLVLDDDCIYSTSAYIQMLSMDES